MITIGTFLMALSVNFVFEPFHIVIGGVTGIGIVVKEFTKQLLWFQNGIPLWITNVIMNVPLFILGVIIKGKRLLARTAYATIALTLFLSLIPIKGVLSHNLLMNVIYGGGIMGLGLGMVLMCDATTGVTDLMAMLLQGGIKHYSVAQIMAVIDGIIVILGAVSFGIETAMYALVAIYITTKVTDQIMGGLHFAKVAWIISREAEQISDVIMDKVDRGITGIESVGMFTKENKTMLMCAVSKKELVKVKEIVKTIDKHAFILIMDAKEILGEGFIE